jgi:hypothetical protein
VRLWLLVLPLPKVPPRPLMIMPISSKTDKAELRIWHDAIERKMTERGMHHISYNVDGAQTERSLTHDIHNEAAESGNMKTWIFKHPQGTGSLAVEAPLLSNGQPRVMGTDGKHAKKNGRNAASSGARVLAMGHFIVHWGQLRALAESKDTPLLKADVIGVDKQDDRAAARLFSSATIDHISKTQPTEIGLAIYLYIIGGLIDAQQNRSISFNERMILLWRGRFFLEGWRGYIMNHPSYNVNTHFLAREYYDILSIFVNAMLGLIFIHRDYYPTIPLLLWLHSTEGNEHFFGCGRALQAAFSFVQFLQMIWKIVSYMTSQATRKKIAQAAANVKKSGYHYFWHDVRKLDPVALSTWPSNQECEEAIATALGEAHALLEICGMEHRMPDEHQLRELMRSPVIITQSEDGILDTSSQLCSEDTDAQYLSKLLHLNAEETDLFRGSKAEGNMIDLSIAATSMYLADTSTL